MNETKFDRGDTSVLSRAAGTSKNFLLRTALWFCLLFCSGNIFAQLQEAITKPSPVVYGPISTHIRPYKIITPAQQAIIKKNMDAEAAQKGGLPGVMATKTWIGSGSGGAGTDFNTAANWSPAGVPTSADNVLIAMTTSGNCNLSGNVTVNNFTFTVSGNSTCVLDVTTHVVTINGATNMDAISYSNPFNYSYLEVNLNGAGAGMIFNGAATIHSSTGQGTTYIYANTSNPGFLKFYSTVTIGIYGQTAPPLEPEIHFDAAGAQAVNYNNIGTYFLGQQVYIGEANSPTLTFSIGAGGVQAYFVYDGGVTIGNSSVINGMQFAMDRYSGVTALAGTSFSMASGTTLHINYTNQFPASYNAYALNANSLTEYMGSASAQTVSSYATPYGNLWIGGSGNKTSGGNFTVAGLYWIEPGATNLGSNRTHTLLGDFQNDGTLTSNTSTFIFNGSVAQDVAGTSQTSFYKLTIDNSSGVSNGVFLNSTNASPITTVSNVLALTNGPLKLNSQKLVVSSAATTAVTRTNGYVVSENNAAVNPSIMQWNIGATTGAHIFPFGTAAGTYLPVTINNSGNVGNISIDTRPTINSCTVPAGTAGTCNQPWPGATNVAAVANMNDVTASDISISSVVDRWWNIASSLASPIPGITLSLTYEGAENSLTTPGNALAIQHWNGSVWDNGNNGGSGSFVATGSTGSAAAGAHTVTGSSAFTYFSPYVLVDVNLVLPIQLLYFDAAPKENAVAVNWATASEVNNDHFDVERSIDGHSFEFVSRVDAKGTGNNLAKQSYYCTDTKPYAGTSYYRLKQTDKNGAYKYFDMKSVTMSRKSFVSVFPNPAVSRMIINVSDDYVNTNAKIIDILGKEVATLKISSQNNSVDLSSVSAGVYYLQVDAAPEKIKIIVEK